MEKEADSSNGFRVSDKISSLNSDFDKSIKFELSTMMRMNLDLPSAGDDAGGGSNAGGMGPTNISGGADEAVGYIYLNNTSCSQTFVKSSNLQRLDIFSSSYSNKSPEMAGFAFTYAQRKELERQAMIYKYMISCVPVPPYLLFPFSRNSSASSMYNPNYTKNGDPEPGRCKRTDGKKWRCSREVVPNQKYCERHLHRGRPRSRKPVEVKNNGDNHMKTRLRQTKCVSTVVSSQQIGAVNKPLLLFSDKADPGVSTDPYGGDHRNLGLTLEAKVEHMMEAKMGLSNEAFSIYTSTPPIFHQDCMEQHQQTLNFFPNSNFTSPGVGFIDAWSVDNMKTTNNRDVESSISLKESNLSPWVIRMEDNAGNYDDEHKTNQSMLLSPVSWEPFGWPLGEALQSGSVAAGGSNVGSPYNSISTPATTVSSASGVLHWTLFSDGSVCNSPSFGASTSDERIL